MYCYPSLSVTILLIGENGTRTLHSGLAGRLANDQCTLVIVIREPLMFDGRGLNSLEKDKNSAGESECAWSLGYRMFHGIPKSKGSLHEEALIKVPLVASTTLRDSDWRISPVNRKKSTPESKWLCILAEKIAFHKLEEECGIP